MVARERPGVGAGCEFASIRVFGWWVFRVGVGIGDGGVGAGVESGDEVEGEIEGGDEVWNEGLEGGEESGLVEKAGLDPVLELVTHVFEGENFVLELLPHLFERIVVGICWRRRLHLSSFLLLPLLLFSGASEAGVPFLRPFSPLKEVT